MIVDRVASRSAFFAFLALTAAAWLVYHNSFAVPFVFDDGPAIVQNASIEHLWPIGPVLHPPADGRTVSGRPLLNLSFAINRAIGGTQVLGYHLVNVAIHIAAAFAVFGIARQTLLRAPLKERFGQDGSFLAFAISLLWLVHPLQTEAVTYIVQRAESLASLFYLLTLYGFVRAAASLVPVRWQAFSLVSCALGMASKEIMVTAPLIVLLYDRTFVAGTFRRALRSRPFYYAGLAAPWLLLGWLVRSEANRGGTVGFHSEISSWNYALTQADAIVHYLWLALWPHPLIFDYGTAVASRVPDVFLSVLLLALIGLSVAVALRRRPILGFLGCWFFFILAPSSSVIPIASQTMAEHRMYLPLVSLIALGLGGLYFILGRRSGFVYLAVGVVFGGLTFERNRVYQTSLSLWYDTVIKRPFNARAHFNLALLLARKGEFEQAIGEYQLTLGLDERNSEVHLAYADLLVERGNMPKAMAEFAEATRLNPGSSLGHFSFANALAWRGRLAESITEYEEALRLRPDYSLAQVNLGNALQLLNRGPEAVAHYEAALKLDASSYQAHYNLANSLVSSGETEKALDHFVEALRLRPDSADAHDNLGNLLVRLGRLNEAASHYEAVERLEPGSVQVQKKLADLFTRANRPEEAAVHYLAALKLNPNESETHYNFGNVLSALGRTRDALAHYDLSLQLNPMQADSHTNMGTTLAQAGEMEAALRHFEAAAKIDPQNANIHSNLANALASLGRLAEARRECEEALRIDRRNTSALELLAQMSASDVKW